MIFTILNGSNIFGNVDDDDGDDNNIFTTFLFFLIDNDTG
jgi:hypothetical protein